MRAGRAVRIASVVALLAAGGTLAFVAWLKLAPRVTPRGQPPLTSIESSGEIRDAFNARSETTTILALLSPT